MLAPIPSDEMEEIRTPLAVIRRLLANNQSSSDTAVQDHFKAALDGKWEQVHAQPMRVLLNQGIESRERECPVHARALAGRCTPLVCEAVTGIFLACVVLRQELVLRSRAEIFLPHYTV